MAIANDRIESIENGQVTFRYKDYTQRGRWRTMTLSAHEFLRRFLWHVLPKGLVRIRTFGFLAGQHRAPLLARCRVLLHATAPTAQAKNGVDPEFAGEGRPCAHCERGIMRVVAELPRPRESELVARTYGTGWYDSS